MSNNFSPTRALGYVKELLLGIIIFLLISITVIISSPLYLLRYGLEKTSKYLNPSLGNMVTAMGQFMATEEFGKTSRCAIITVLIIEKSKKSLEEIKEIIVKKLLHSKVSPKGGQLQYPELRQYITTWLGFRFWKPETDFSVDEHIHIVRPDSFSSEQLRDSVEDLMNEPFPAEKSPWKITLVENYKDLSVSSEPLKLMVIKTHHALADGYGVLYTFVQGISEDGLDLPKARYASDARNFWKTLAFNLTFPIRAFLELLTFTALIIRPHPWKVPDSKKSWKQLYGHSEVIPISKIKFIKDKFGVSFASVVNSAHASATRQSLLRKFGSEGDIECTPCAVILPLPNHPKILRNHATGVLQYLPTMDCDPIERLKICEKDLQAAKKSTFPLLAHFFIVVTSGLTVGLTDLLGKNRSFPVGMSSFPLGGMKSKKYELFGGEMLGIQAALGGLPGVLGVCCLAYTYLDGVQFTVSVENSLMTHKDISHFIECLVNELEVLHKLALA